MSRRRQPEKLLIIQLLLHEEVDDEAGTYNATLILSGRDKHGSGYARAIHAVPVLGRSPGQIATKLVDLLKDLNVVAADPVIISPPSLEVDANYASGIVRTYRTFTEDLLRDREVAMLEELWQNSPPTAEYDVRDFDTPDDPVF